MRHLSAITIEATFSGDPPRVGHLKGVSNVRIMGHQLSAQVHGSIDEFLTVLARAHPKTLLAHEPSLEELFLSIYDGSEIRNKASEK
jgi:ABC-2 type transport system ATP-binding protein